jgi:hypothetical protein
MTRQPTSPQRDERGGDSRDTVEQRCKHVIRPPELSSVLASRSVARRTARRVARCHRDALDSSATGEAPMVGAGGQAPIPFVDEARVERLVREPAFQLHAGRGSCVVSGTSWS